MNERDELRRLVLEQFPMILDGVAINVSATRHGLAEADRDRLATGRFFVVVCGEFRRGKSSLLNALLRRPGLFPVDVDLTTSAVVTLAYSEREHAVVYFAEPADDAEPTPDPREIKLKEVADYVTEQGNPENVKSVIRVEVGASIAELRSGLVLVDTPGVGSFNPAHSAATRAFLPHADAILFVGSAAEPLTTLELDLLKRALADCPVVITAITMIDKVVDASPVVAAARLRIADATGAPADDLVVLPVSALRRHRATEEGDAELDAESGFPEMESTLWEGLTATCAAAQLHDALDGLDLVLLDVATPIRDELSVLRDPQVLPSLDARLKAARTQAADLLARRGTWSQMVRKDVETETRGIRRRLEDDFVEVRRDFEATLDGDEVRIDGRGLMRKVADGMLAATQRSERELLRVMNDIAARHSRSLTVTLPKVADSGSIPGAELRPRVRRKDGRGFRHFRATWSGGLAGAGLGATAGGIIGSFIPVVGTILGAVVGGLIGKIWGWMAAATASARDAAERERREAVAHLRGQVILMIDSTRRRALDDLRNQVTDMTDALLQALDEEIAVQAGTIEDSVRRIVATQARTLKERAERLPVVELADQKVQEVQEVLNGLRERVNRLGETSPVRRLSRESA